MWWVQMIVGAVDGLLQGSAGRATAKANNRLNALNAEVGNKLRTAKNAASAAETSLARWSQSVQNNRRLDRGGDAIEANTVNYRRQSDAAITQGFSSSIRDAEQQGVMAAQAAASGVDGNVVDAVNTSVALRNSIVKQGIENMNDYRDYDASRRAGNIMSQMVGGLDNSILMDNFDYNIDVAQETPVFSHWMNAIQGSGKGFNVGGQGADVMTKKQSDNKYTTEGLRGTDGYARLGSRERSSSPYDLADQSYDTGVKFGFKASDKSSYELSGRLGDNDREREEAASIYSLWSR